MNKNFNIALAFAAVTLTVFAGSLTAFAGDCRHDDHDVARDVHSYRPMGNARSTSRVLQCGDVITSNVTLAADLLCPTTTGFALYVEGSNITFDGNGHKIVAPLAAAGLFVQGSNNTIRNLKVNGVGGGDGILAYDTPGLHVTGNDLSGNLQGFVLYADSGVIDGVDIKGNVARNNALFGIRVGFDAPASILSPRVRGNDVSGSGSFGLLLKVSKLDYGSDEPNLFGGSLNGIYLAGGDVSLHDFSLFRERLARVGVFADSLDSLSVSNVDVRSQSPATADQGRIGMDLYRVANFTVTGLDGSGNDVGVKLETELGVDPAGKISGCRFLDDVVSGILVVSYDGTPYGLLSFVKNCYREAAPALHVLVIPGTVVAAGSITDDGLNACGNNGGGCDGGSGHSDGHDSGDDSGRDDD